MQTQINTQKGWYVLYVKYKNEKKIHNVLKERGVESFLPLVTTVKQWSDRRKKIIEPLFPSYLFVNIKNSQDIGLVLNIKESCFFIKNGQKYATVKDEEIENIKLLLSLDGISDIQRSDSITISPGRKYRIECGILKGLVCEVFRVENRNTVKVFVSSIKQSVLATVPEHYLVPVLTES